MSDALELHEGGSSNIKEKIEGKGFVDILRNRAMMLVVGAGLIAAPTTADAQQPTTPRNTATQPAAKQAGVMGQSAVPGLKSTVSTANVPPQFMHIQIAAEALKSDLEGTFPMQTREIQGAIAKLATQLPNIDAEKDTWYVSKVKPIVTKDLQDQVKDIKTEIKKNPGKAELLTKLQKIELALTDLTGQFTAYEIHATARLCSEKIRGPFGKERTRVMEALERKYTGTLTGTLTSLSARAATEKGDSKLGIALLGLREKIGSLFQDSPKNPAEIAPIVLEESLPLRFGHKGNTDFEAAFNGNNPTIRTEHNTVTFNSSKNGEGSILLEGLPAGEYTVVIQILEGNVSGKGDWLFGKTGDNDWHKSVKPIPINKTLNPGDTVTGELLVKDPTKSQNMLLVKPSIVVAAGTRINITVHNKKNLAKGGGIEVAKNGDEK